MKIKELLHNVARLVESREIIDHGSIRCLYSDEAAREIETAEGCESADTGLVGDDDLSSDLWDLANNGDAISEIDFEDLSRLENAYRGDDIQDYLDSEKEDELLRLDALIDAARELV